MRHFDQAALFLESCLEYGLIVKTDETGTVSAFRFVPYPSILSSFDPSCVSGICQILGELGLH